MLGVRAELLALALDPRVPASLGELLAMPFRQAAALWVMLQAWQRRDEDRAMTQAHQAAMAEFERRRHGR
jgi:hypothetical protein